MRKNIIGSLVLSVIAMFLGAISYYSKIANPFVGLKGLAQIAISERKVEKISDKPLRYISKPDEDFTNYMESEGYTVEQFGRGFTKYLVNKKMANLAIFLLLKQY